MTKLLIAEQSIRFMEYLLLLVYTNKAENYFINIA